MKRSLAPSQRFSLHRGLAPKSSLVAPRSHAIPSTNVHNPTIETEPRTSESRDCVSDVQTEQPKLIPLARTPLRSIEGNTSAPGARAVMDDDVDSLEIPGDHSTTQIGVQAEGEAPAKQLPTPATARRQPLLLKRTSTPMGHHKLSAPVAPSKPADDDGPELRYWEVFWTKASKKKHKTWADGVLIVKGNTAQLVKEDGEVATKTTMRCNSSLRPEQLVYIGSFECEVIKLISEDEYIAKGADMAASQALAQPRCNLFAAANKKKMSFAGSRFPGKPQPTPDEEDLPSQAKPAKNFVIDPERHGAYVLTAPGAPIVVATDPVLGLHLKPHQVEGVRFLFRSVMRSDGHCAVNGCILADEMGLGKTLQSIALIWTLLKQSPTSLSVPAAKKAVVVCPSSLVFNWANEMKKWLGDQRAPTQTVMSGQGAKEAVRDFVNGNVRRVLIISYDMLRRHMDALSQCEVGLLVCDEGQRLKNIEGNKTIDALNALPCGRRVLLSGTPIQNDLDEFYAMFSFICPGLLGNPRQFRLVFADSIVRSRDKHAPADLKRVGRKRLRELARRTGPFLLRRTARSVADALPPKLEHLVFCRPSGLQRSIYQALLGGAQARKAMEGQDGTVVLSLIAKLSKVLNHPDLVRTGPAPLAAEEVQGGAESSLAVDPSLFPPDYRPLDPASSGKMAVLLGLLAQIRALSNDRVVVVSNYTTTLDVLEKLCNAAGFPWLRLDGATEVSKRSSLVQTFNNSQSDSFVFLLSSKAGGCGLNLIGANRMILVDPSWNPAHDAQAMGRVWRFGQTKPCFIYRMLTTGTMEERILQKQIRKGELESLVVDDQGESAARHFDKSEIKNIFILRGDTACDTFQLLSDTPEFTAAEQQGVPVVASYACHSNILELPALKDDDPALCFALAEHSSVVSFLMSKRQSPEDAKAPPKSAPTEQTSCSDSGSELEANDSSRTHTGVCAAGDTSINSDDDFDMPQGCDVKSEPLRACGDDARAEGEGVSAREEKPRKRRRLVSNDSDADG